MIHMNKYLIKKSNNKLEMLNGKGQVGMEYLIVTIFVLTAVVIIFVFAYINYDQNVKIAGANDTLTSLVNIADEIYLRGRGNTRFVDVGFPKGMKEFQVVNFCADETEEACGTGSEGNEEGCNCDGEIILSGLRITVGLIAGDTEITRLAKTELLLVNFPDVSEAAGGPAYTFRAEWDTAGEKIKLERI